jgi:hypothetical protein
MGVGWRRWRAAAGDGVGVGDHGVGHVLAIIAAAPKRGVVGGQHVLHVAQAGPVGEHAVGGRVEGREVRVDVVEIAIEHDLRWCRLAGRGLQDRREGGGVAVEPTDHIQRRALKHRRPGEILGAITVRAAGSYAPDRA